MLSARNVSELLNSRAQYKAQLLNYISVLDGSEDTEVQDNMAAAIESTLYLLEVLDNNINKLNDMNRAEGYLV